MPAYLNAVGVCLPNKPVPNEKVEAVLGRVGDTPSTVRDIILGRNGIRWRYYAIDPLTSKATHTNAQLTAAAIRALVNATGLAWEDIDLLACGTSSPDQAIPNHAAMVHGLLGSPPCEIVSTAGVCCSGMTAMKYAYASVLAGLNAAAIVTGSESASSALKASQFANGSNGHAVDHPFVGFNQEFLRFMLSDGAGAALIEPQPRSPGPALHIDWLDLTSFANELPACMYSGAAKQADGSLRGSREEDQGVAAVVEKGYFNLSQDVNLLGRQHREVGGPLLPRHSRPARPEARRDRLVLAASLVAVLPEAVLPRARRQRLRDPPRQMVHEPEVQRQHGFGLDLHHP